MSETYQVGEMVQVELDEHGWVDAVIDRIEHRLDVYGQYTACSGGTALGVRWIFEASGPGIRKHPANAPLDRPVIKTAPSTGPAVRWQVGDTCEVRSRVDGRPWRAAVVKVVNDDKMQGTCSPSSMLRRPTAAQSDKIKRPPGCQCHLEVGDSPCSVHPSQDDLADPLDAVIDGVTLRDLLALDVARRREQDIGAGTAAPISWRNTDPWTWTPAQHAAISAFREAELRAKVASGPSEDAERWRRERRAVHQVTYNEED